MNSSSIKEYLNNLEKFGINLGLDRITYLLEKLGNPHLKFKSIHIAGTNGKGSTAAIIASVLKEAGYKVGLYTSPHLFDYRERIKINGRDISKRDFQEGLRLIKMEPRIHLSVPGNPTIFEVLTAVAFWYFTRKKVDYAVVEVGMGGRLDATNVITPLVSVITNIDYEHTEVLGKTLPKIAREKAAIIKPGVPVVTAEAKIEALKVIRKISREKSSQLLIVEPRRLPAEVRRAKEGSVSGSIPGFKLRGFHQRLNATCALSALLLAGIKVSKSAIRKGLKKTNWPGRFQIVSRKPLVIVDGAHNLAGARALRVTIEEMYPQKKFTLIFGMQGTKNHKKTLKELKSVIRSIIVTKSSHKQAADPKTLARQTSGQKIAVTSSVKEALSHWDRQSPLLITGSLFLVADALRFFI